MLLQSKLPPHRHTPPTVVSVETFPDEEHIVPSCNVAALILLRIVETKDFGHPELV